MSIQDPATHARARQQASYRYEAARRDLVRTLDQRMTEDSRIAHRAADELVQRRQAMEQASHMLVPLSRYIERELRSFADRGEAEEQLVDVDDVLMDAVIATHEEFPGLRDTRGMYPWLRRISQACIREAVQSEADRAQAERSLDAPIRIAGADWPDHVLVLRDVLADPNAVLPEQVLEQQATRELLDTALDLLPERWREVFLLRSVDARDDDEIAAAEGIDVADVEMINIAARAYLRESLRDCEELLAK